MSTRTSLMFLLAAFIPAFANAQSTFVYGAAGPTYSDSGHGLSTGIGFCPASGLMLVLDVQRTHAPTRVTRDGDVISTDRFGTTTMATGEARVVLLGREHVSPYVTVGFGAGVSRPNVNALFPERVTHHVRGPVFGGGVHLPLRERLAAFADVRIMLLIGDDPDGLSVVIPIRGGVAWRF